jgi:transcription elongation factor SPT6
MSRSDDEDSNLYGDEQDDNSVAQNFDEEGEDIGYNRKRNPINDDDDDDDEDEEEEEEDEEEARKVKLAPKTRLFSLHSANNMTL